MAERHGGKILIDQLAIQGCDRVFCVPGESYLAALDGLHGHNDIQTIVCRQEGGAAMMAEAHGKMTGRPGIAFVTRGPGATNASAGVHIAYQDSTPMILFVGQVRSDNVDRECFQEIDYRRMFSEMTKWVAQIDHTDRIPEYVSHAYHLAMSGRPGPVVLALPEDMLSASAEVADAKPATRIEAKAGSDDLEALRQELAKAQRPFVVLGGGGWCRETKTQMQAFAESFDLPVGVSFRCQDYFDNDHPNYAGDVGIGINPKLMQRVKDSDLLIVVGARLGEMTSSGYSLIDIPNPAQIFVHVYPGPDELGRVYRPDLAINASSRSFAGGMAALPPGHDLVWQNWTRSARQDYEANSKPQETPGDVKLEAVIAHLRDNLPADAILTNGAGNYTAWLHRYYRYRDYRTQLAPTSGSMGYGLPAAVAGQLAAPGRTVICFAGDGCFLMTGQELATAVQYDLPLIVIVVNNSMYGTIRMHQERHYPGRVSGTELRNPDFALLARAYGAQGEKVTRTEDFPAALQRAIAAEGPALIELITSPEAVAPRLTMTQLKGSA